MAPAATELEARWLAARRRGRQRIGRLLDTLCSDLGLMLSGDARAELIDDPAASARYALEPFVASVLRAGGPGESAGPVLREQVRTRVAAALDEVSFMQVRWPDGSVIAQVSVSPNGDPIHTAHVGGTFEVGPGFERLEPRLLRVQQLHTSGDRTGAFAASEAIDDLGIMAVDELGRPYRLFNIQFGDGLLFGAAREGW